MRHAWQDLSTGWPELDYGGWHDTLATLHRYTQVVGKVRLGLTPLVNHWWNVTLFVHPRGLTTGAIPYGGDALELQLDLIDHNLIVSTSRHETRALALVPRSVAEFYDDVMRILAALGIDVDVRAMPVELMSEVIPLDEDREHRAYDAAAAQRFFQVLLHSHNVLSEFRAGFIGKSSPVQFFWGSFDLALSRFSGRRAPERPDADAVTREAYSHEVMSVGFWPGDDRLREPAYYAYAAPQPEGFDVARIGVDGAYYHRDLKELILPYDAVRRAASPRAAILTFAQAAYDAAAQLAKWDPALSRPVEDAGPPPPSTRAQPQRAKPRPQPEEPVVGSQPS